MTNYLRMLGWTLLTVTIIHGHRTGVWHELHEFGLMLSTMSFAGAEGL